MKRLMLSLVFFAALLAIWEVLVRIGVWSAVLLPSPLSVAQYLRDAALDGTLADASWVTMRRLLAGYFAGIALGLPLGLLTARFRFLRDTLGLIALGLQTLPSVCWVPLALLWFGQTEGAMFFVVIMGTVWSMIIATETGVRNVPPIYARAALTMGSSGMKQGWAFAWRSLMAAEIYVTVLSGFGLGHLLHYGRELNAMEQVIGVMVVIITIGLLADKVLFSPCERFLHRRWGTSS